MPDLVEQRLALWLRPVSTASERVEAVRKGLAELSPISGAAMLDMVALAYGTADTVPAETLRAAISEFDAGFVGDPGDDETRIVAAAAIVQQLGTADSALLAMAVQSAEYIGLAAPIPDLPTAANTALSHKSETTRVRSLLGPPVKAPVDPFKDLAWPEDEPVSAADLTALLSATKRALANQRSATDRITEATQSARRIADEELDLLAWTLAAQASGDGKPFAALGAAGPVLASMDVYTRTKFVSPAPGSRGLIRKVIDSTPVTLQAAIEEAGAEVEMEFGGGRHALTPVLHCLDAAQELDYEKEWVAVASKRSALDLTSDRDPVELAMQLLREQILAIET